LKEFDMNRLSGIVAFAVLTLLVALLGNAQATVLAIHHGGTTNPGLSGGGTVYGTIPVPIDLAAFNSVGLLDGVSGNIGGGAIAGSLYYAFNARALDREGNVLAPGYTKLLPGAANPSNAFGGGELIRDGNANPILGVGNSWNNWGTGLYGIDGADLSPRFDPSPNYSPRFLVQINYAASANDTVIVTAYLNGLTYTRTFAGDASFDAFQFRSGHSSATYNNRWEFSELYIATTALEAFQLPEPTTLTLLALGGLGLWRRRRARA
jgi:hypothetical protein